MRSPSGVLKVETQGGGWPQGDPAAAPGLLYPEAPGCQPKSFSEGYRNILDLKNKTKGSGPKYKNKSKTEII